MCMMQHRKDFVYSSKGKDFSQKKILFPIYNLYYYIFITPSSKLWKNPVIRCCTDIYKRKARNKKVTRFHEIRAKK